MRGPPLNTEVRIEPFEQSQGAMGWFLGATRATEFTSELQPAAGVLSRPYIVMIMIGTKSERSWAGTWRTREEWLGSRGEILLVVLAALVLSLTSCGSGSGSAKAGLRVIEDGPNGVIQISGVSCMVPTKDPTEAILSGQVTNRLSEVAYPIGSVVLYNSSGTEVGQGGANLPIIMKPNRTTSFSVAISVSGPVHTCELKWER